MANKNPVNNQRPDRGPNKKQGNDKLNPVEEAELKRHKLARQYGIKTRTKNFVDELIDNPKQTIGEAYIKTHKTASKRNASIAGSKLLKKPSVIGYKNSAVGKAKRRVIELVESANESIALKASQDIIDRNEGKAIQKSENISKVVEVKLDLTGVRLGAHHVRGELLDG